MPRAACETLDHQSGSWTFQKDGAVTGRPHTIVDCCMNDNSEHPVECTVQKPQRPVGRVGVAAVIAVTLAACSLAPPTPDNQRALDDIAARRGGAEEVVTGAVLRVLPLHQGPSGVHERFIVAVRAGGTSLPLYVTDNVSVGQIAPLRAGDQVTVKGELAFDDLGPLLHWTHRDPRMRHIPGFVMVGGHIYE